MTVDPNVGEKLAKLGERLSSNPSFLATVKALESLHFKTREEAETAIIDLCFNFNPVLNPYAGVLVHRGSDDFWTVEFDMGELFSDEAFERSKEQSFSETFSSPEKEMEFKAGLAELRNQEFALGTAKRRKVRY